MTLGLEGRFQRLAVPLSVAAMLLFPATMPAEEAGAKSLLEQEIEYINALSTQGYVDFAPAAIEAAKAKWPSAKGVFEAVTIRAELMAGKQDEVIKRIQARPDQNSLETWLLKLELANSYVMYSKFSEADKLYADFFKRFPKVAADLRRTYIDAAFSYLQMLGKIDRLDAALPIYKLAMENSPTDPIMKDFRSQYLQAMLVQAAKLDAKDGKRAQLINEAEALAKKMVWVADNYFGDAIVGLARVKMMRGDLRGAQEMIREYLPDLKSIHDQLRAQDPDGSKGFLRVSPLPQCRFLIGTMLYEQVKQELGKGDKADDNRVRNLLLGDRNPQTKKRNGQGAFNHLVNVYNNYPECQSAAAAGDLVEEIANLIEDRYGKRPRANVTAEQREKVRAQQFIGADVKFNSGDWAGAAEAYSKMISQYGFNNTAAMRSAKNMVECFVRSGAKSGKLDPYAKLQAQAVTAALAEGFSGVPKLYELAGATLNQIGDFYGEVGLKEMQDETAKLFFKFYPKHAGAVSMQLKVAAEKAKSGQAEEAEKLYLTVAESAKDNDAQRQVRARALSELVSLYQPDGAMPNPAKELRAADDFVKHFEGIKRPGATAAVAYFNLADAYRHVGEDIRKNDKEGTEKKKVLAAYTQATKIYSMLEKELSEKNSRFATTSAEARQNAPLLEASIYQAGVCMQRLAMTGNEKTDLALKKKAAELFGVYLKKYPKGKIAPAAMLQIGTIEAASGDIESSQKTLDDLAKRFPQSNEAKNSIPLLADSLFKMGMKGEAVKTYKKMFAAAGTYTPGQYLEAAKRLLDAKEGDLAIEAADCVLKGRAAPAQVAQAMLVRTRALLQSGKPADAYKQVTALLEKFGRSTVALEGNLLLIDVVGEQMAGEKTLAGRNKLIREAKDAVKFINAANRAKENDPEEKKIQGEALSARLNLAIADLARKAYEAEAEANGDQVERALGDAINAYRTASSTGLYVKDIPPAIGIHVEDAYLGSLQLIAKAAEMQKTDADKKLMYKDLIDIGGEYMEKFPEGKHRTEVTTMLTQARIAVGA